VTTPTLYNVQCTMYNDVLDHLILILTGVLQAVVLVPYHCEECAKNAQAYYCKYERMMNDDQES